MGFVLGVLVSWILGGFSGGESGHLDLISFKENFFLVSRLVLNVHHEKFTINTGEGRTNSSALDKKQI